MTKSQPVPCPDCGRTDMHAHILPWEPETFEQFVARKENNVRVLQELHEAGELPPHSF